MNVIKFFNDRSYLLNVKSLEIGMKAKFLSLLRLFYVPKIVIVLATFLFSFSVIYSANALTLSQTPLFVGQNAQPTIMFAMSRDQELFYKAYPDYSNLSGGKLTMSDLTYRNDFSYAGYFDPDWCYEYDKSSATISDRKFVPYSATTDHKCVANKAAGKGRWSGNFLNWASMTRIDILRKVLYGGKRTVDTAALNGKAATTVLERAFIPKDSHAFAKVFTDIPAAGAKPASKVSDYTPYDDQTVMSFCNVSTDSSTTGYPVIRVAKGAWAQWDHTEIQQCQWRGVTTTQVTSPKSTTDMQDELVAKVSVCEPTKDGATNTYIDSSAATELNRCKSYESGSYKPIGLLQKFYGKVKFGLVSGTWGKNNSGGVLRKKASKLAGNTYSGADNINEFSEANGVFNSNIMTSTTATGLIKTIDAMRIAGYSYTATATGNSYSNTNDWGNPIGEIYAETLRYLVGKASPTNSFASVDTGFTSETAWDDPVPASSWCSRCSIIIISSGPNSYDGDDLTTTYLATINSSLSRSTLDTKTDAIGQAEFGSVYNTVFYGVNSNLTNPKPTLNDQCKPTSVKMSQLFGKCPENPTSMGSYDVAGLAFWAHTNDLRALSGYPGNQTISTYAVELSEGLPSLSIPMGPDSDPNKKIFSFSPVCINTSSAAGTPCALVGVVVENLVYLNNDSTQQPIKGSYLFYWEDQPWGSDYDLDAVQRIEFCVGPTVCKDTKVNSNQIKITNTLPYWQTGTGGMKMSYIVSGIVSGTTVKDGLQDTEYVQRTGNAPHNFGHNSVLGSLSWYNALGSNITPLPAWSDPLPQDNGSNIYTHSKNFTPTGATITTVNTPLYYAAKWGSFLNDPINSNADNKPDPAEWDTKNLDGTNTPDGIPDGYFMMKNPSLLEKRLNDIVAGAVDQVASGSGVSTNSTKLDTGTRIYQARFYSKGWYGDLRSLSLDSDPTKGYKTEWSTLEHLNSVTGRKIFSSSSGAGIVFDTTNWSTKYTSDQQSALGGSTTGPNVINWVRGSDVTSYRSRKVTTYSVDENGNKTIAYNDKNQLMGDIVNSTPIYSGAESSGFEALDAVYGSASYADYVSNVKAKRKDVVYVGANDGMLHAIDAQTGDELFAYVPTMIYNKLPTIASPYYGISTAHTYTVDGPISVGDAYINGSWKTILIGTLGAGAAGVFALDVTNPESFTKDNVLFEINTDDSGVYKNDIGNVMGKPIIAPVAGRWKAIFGNGYNSKGGKGELFVVDIEKPFDSSFSKAIVTSTSGNGLSAPVAIQNPATGAVNYVYAGDLLGNMWRFDVSSTSTSSWTVSFSGSPLFIAKDASNKAQPIFGAPTLGKNAKLDNATMVYFGTGKYIEDTDVAATTLQQSFYGIADQNTKLTYSVRTDVLQQKNMTTDTSVSPPTRHVDDNGNNVPIVDWVHKKGWYLDFPVGERIITKPLLLYDRLLFSTVVPNSDLCSFGGSGWLMELVGIGDVFGNNKQLLPNNGNFLDYFLPGDLTKLKSDKGTVLNECNIKGDCEATILNDPAITADGLGRISWRQVR